MHPPSRFLQLKILFSQENYCLVFALSHPKTILKGMKNSFARAEGLGSVMMSTERGMWHISHGASWTSFLTIYLPLPA